MKNSGRISANVATWLVCGPLAYAGETIAPQNPYTAITARNAFSLENIIIQPPVPPKAEPLPKIVLKGLMTILGPEQVLFSVVQNSAGAQPSESFYVLVEGEHRDGIEVVRIDATTGTVIFNNHGMSQRISWADSSANTSRR